MSALTRSIRNEGELKEQLNLQIATAPCDGYFQCEISHINHNIEVRGDDGIVLLSSTQLVADKW